MISKSLWTAAGFLLACQLLTEVTTAPATHGNAISQRQTEITEYTADDSGCYYNFLHYEEGDRIITNEPCLNCTCHNRMLMCYLRVCPFTKAIGQDCIVEKKPDQCCPIITCPEVPVKLLTSSTTSAAPPTTTEVGFRDNYGCTMQDNQFYADGARVPSDPKKPCELCYCIRNQTACVMQECTLHVEGCRPVFEPGICCPVRYDCDYNNESSTTTGTILRPTTAASVPADCRFNDNVYSDGESITTDKPCEHCYCMRGDIVCAVQDCGEPLRGKDCIATTPPPGQCCPTSYACANETATDSFPESEKMTTSSSFIEPLSTVTYEGPQTTVGQNKSSEDAYVKLGESSPTISSESPQEHIDDHHEVKPEIFDKLKESEVIIPSKGEGDGEKDVITPVKEGDLISTSTSENPPRPSPVLDGEHSPSELPTSQLDGNTTPYPLEAESNKPVDNFMASSVGVDFTQPESEYQTTTSIDSSEQTSPTVELFKPNKADHVTTLNPEISKAPSEESRPSNEGSKQSIEEPNPSSEELKPSNEEFNPPSGEPTLFSKEPEPSSEEFTHSNEQPTLSSEGPTSFSEEPKPSSEETISSSEEPNPSNDKPKPYSEESKPPFNEDSSEERTKPSATKPDESLEEQTTPSQETSKLSLDSAEHLGEEITEAFPNPSEEGASEPPKSSDIGSASELATTLEPLKPYSNASLENGRQTTIIPESPNETHSSFPASVSTEEMVTIKIIENPTTTSAESSQSSSSSAESLSYSPSSSYTDPPSSSSEIPSSSREPPLSSSEFPSSSINSSSTPGQTISSPTNESPSPFAGSPELSRDSITDSPENAPTSIDSIVSSNEKDASFNDLSTSGPIINPNESESSPNQDEASNEELSTFATHELTQPPSLSLYTSASPSSSSEYTTILPESSDFTEIPQGVNSSFQEENAKPSEESSLISHTTAAKFPIDYLEGTATKPSELETTTTENSESTAKITEEPSENDTKLGEYPSLSTKSSSATESTATYETSFEETTQPPSYPFTEGAKESSSSESATEIFKETSSPDQSISSELPTKSSFEEVTEFGLSEGTTPFYPSSSEVFTTVESSTSPSQNNSEEQPIIPGEGSCLVESVTYSNMTVVPSSDPCHEKCLCVSSILTCSLVNCPPPPSDQMKCSPLPSTPESCCQTYVCDGEESNAVSPMTSENQKKRPEEHHDSFNDAVGDHLDDKIDNDGEKHVETPLPKAPEIVSITTISTVDPSSFADVNPFSEGMKQPTTQETKPHDVTTTVKDNVVTTTQISEESSSENQYDSTDKTGNEYEKPSSEKPTEITYEMVPIATSAASGESELQSTLSSQPSEMEEATTPTSSYENQAFDKLGEGESTTPVSVNDIQDETTSKYSETATSHEILAHSTEEAAGAEITTTGASHLESYQPEPEVGTTTNPSIEADSNDVGKPKLTTSIPYEEPAVVTDGSIATESQSEVTTAAEPDKGEEVATPKPELPNYDEQSLPTTLKPEEISELEHHTLISHVETTSTPELNEGQELTTTTWKPAEENLGSTESEKLTVKPETYGSHNESTTTTLENEEYVTTVKGSEEYTPTTEPQKEELTTNPTIIETTIKVESGMTTAGKPEVELEEQEEATMSQLTEDPQLLTDNVSEQVDTTTYEFAETSVPPKLVSSVEDESTLPQELSTQQYGSPRPSEGSNEVVETTQNSSQVEVTTIHSEEGAEGVTTPPRDKLPEKPAGSSSENPATEEHSGHPHESPVSEESIAGSSEEPATLPVEHHETSIPNLSSTTSKITTSAYEKPAAQTTWTHKPFDAEDGQFPPLGEYDDGEDGGVYGPGTCRYGGKVYVSAQQIPRDDPCDFCFCFRSDIICLQQSCPPPIHGCRQEPIQGFCCPRYECPVSTAVSVNLTTTTTTTTTTLPPHFPHEVYRGAARRSGCFIHGYYYRVGQDIGIASGPCLECICGSDGRMKCDPKSCSPEPLLRELMAEAVSKRKK